MENPLVSWLTICQGKYTTLLLASILEQSYSPLEVVVVDAGMPQEDVKLLISHGARVIPAPEQWVLGDLYNLAVQSATGEYVMIADEDDYSSPHRIKVQLKAMLEADAKGCVLTRVTMYDRPTHRAFQSFKRPWEQTLLAHRETFLDCEYRGHNGHDTVALKLLRRKAKVLMLDDCAEHFIYVGTEGSHTGRKHWEGMFQHSTPLQSEDADRYLKMLNERTIRGEEEEALFHLGEESRANMEAQEEATQEVVEQEALEFVQAEEAREDARIEAENEARQEVLDEEALDEMRVEDARQDEAVQEVLDALVEED